jgi:hypothetical protein
MGARRGIGGCERRRRGLADRITIRPIPIEEIDDADAFDLAWMPAPFLPRAVLDAGVSVVTRSLRPGGWLVLRRYTAHRIHSPKLWPNSGRCVEGALRSRTTKRSLSSREEV